MGTAPATAAGSGGKSAGGARHPTGWRPAANAPRGAAGTTPINTTGTASIDLALRERPLRCEAAPASSHARAPVIAGGGHPPGGRPTAPIAPITDTAISRTAVATSGTDIRCRT